MLNHKTRRELLGLALLALALFTLLSLVPLGSRNELVPTENIMGVVGDGFAGIGWRIFGLGVWCVPFLLVLGGLHAFRWLGRDRAVRWLALLGGLTLLAPATTAWFQADALHDFRTLQIAGWIGTTLMVPLIALLGRVGSALLLLFLYAALLLVTLGWNPLVAAVRGLTGAWQRTRPVLARDRVEDDDDTELLPPPLPMAPGHEPPSQRSGGLIAAVTRSEERKAARKAKSRGPVLQEFGDPSSEDRPPLTLLMEAPPQNTSLSDAELDRLGQVLIQTLRTFKVEGEIGGRTTGPVVTQFEVVPAPGVKVNRIAALDADLALALRAPSVRIVAPIPGKGAVGVDVPNPERVVVYLRSILESGAFQRKPAHLPLALGQDLAGRSYVADLTKMPHLLIAGATGSGKSICINTLITSLIYRHAPSALRLLLVDPKMVELSMYADLPHLRHPVVTDPQDAATVLKWAVLEMERRYALLSENGARSLTEFNRRVAEGQPLRRPHPSGDNDAADHWTYTDGHQPYIVLFIDELADLMMSVQAEIEKPLAQLAQKARAIGIHLIVATQRPSVNVITGLIKANFPCRIAFRVSSKVDSRTIIDQNGADALLGNGDMLFMPPGSSDPVRIQGAFISTEDTERVMAWYRERARAQPTEEDILEYVRSREAAELVEESGIEYDGERDALFRQAAEVCVQFRQGSTSLLQRRLRIGYGRAARIIDQLHLAGVLGPPDGSKPREVLVGLESLEAIIGED